MGKPRAPARVKLICSILCGDADLTRRTRQLLVRSFGPVDAEAGPWPFDATDYYEDEMGPGLQRNFLAFANLRQVTCLSEIKRETNDLEAKIAGQCAALAPVRPVNLDPGYMTLEKLVLASTKNHAHRIYLDRGIYAEPTLRYAEGRWQPWPWTFPDFADDRYYAFLTTVRNALRTQLDLDVPQ